MARDAIFVIGALVALAENYVISALPGDETKCQCDESKINRGGFPEGFLFGAATSSYQVEGGYNDGGKGMSIWDNFTHTYPDKIADRANGDVAVDSYHRFKDDVQLAKDLGLDAYRFSISWSRILPGGNRSQGINQEGIDYYNELINELLDNGIRPVVTLFHFNVPQSLQDAYGGFLSSQIVADFLDFSDILFMNFGDRVKHWITLNEPWTFSVLGHGTGKFAPGRCSAWQQLNCTGGDSGTEPYIVTHNQLLAHAAVVDLYRTKYQKWQKGKIGITIVSQWYEPYSDNDEDKKAKDRALDFQLGWFMEPLAHGRYPESMRSRVGNRLPVFNTTEAGKLIGSFDFIGLNYYTSSYARQKLNASSYSYLTDSEVDILVERDNKPIGDVAMKGSWILIYPKGLGDLLSYLKEKYDNPVIFITENGLDEARNDSLKIIEAITDDIRKDYIHDHLCCIHQAIKQNKVNVCGYFVWSLLDNFEWASGYSVRFGLNYVDYKDNLLTRYPKHSAIWFKNILVKQHHAASNKNLWSL